MTALSKNGSPALLKKLANCTTQERTEIEAILTRRGVAFPKAEVKEVVAEVVKPVTKKEVKVTVATPTDAVQVGELSYRDRYYRANAEKIKTYHKDRYYRLKAEKEAANA